MEAVVKWNPLPDLKTNLNSAIALALSFLIVLFLPMLGCSAAQKQTVVNVLTAVHNQMPAVEAAADTVAATASALAPADALLITGGDVTFQAAASALDALIVSYLKNPTASVLVQIQTALATLEGQVNTASLNAVHITDTLHQQEAIIALKGLLTVVSIVFGMVAQTQTVAQIRSEEKANGFTLASVRQRINEDQVRLAVNAQGGDYDVQMHEALALGL